MMDKKGECEYCKQSLANMDDALRQFYEQRDANEALVADAAYYKRKADDMKQAYEAKIQDFAKETLLRSQAIQENARAEARIAEMEGALDAKHVERQRSFSLQTFGPGTRTNGVIEHIRRELKEIEADPLDLKEWADLIILAFDGAWRAGHEPQAIIDAVKAKQAINEARKWPDWRTASPDHAIEHVRNEARKALGGEA